ncbi:MAG: hypothetical protein HQL50_00545 [Magnetococcales bacterium]|nr:hypothetical protein [Magnetococcales bacterium]
MKAKSKGAFSLGVALISLSVSGILYYQSSTMRLSRSAVRPTPMPTFKVDRKALRSISELSPGLESLRSPGQALRPVPFVHLATLFGATSEDLEAEKPSPESVQSAKTTPQLLPALAVPEVVPKVEQKPLDGGAAHPRWNYPVWNQPLPDAKQVDAELTAAVAPKRDENWREIELPETVGDGLMPENKSKEEMEAPPFPKHALSMTFMSPEQQLAVIDGYLYREGDTLSSGVVLASITRNSVTLVRGEERRDVTMESGTIGKVPEHALRGSIPNQAPGKTTPSAITKIPTPSVKAAPSGLPASAKVQVPTATSSGATNNAGTPLGALGLKIVRDALERSNYPQ